MKKILIAALPLVLMGIFILLRLTVGEANAVVYALMALPAPGWPSLYLLIGMAWLWKRRWTLGLIHFGAAAAMVFPLLNPSFGEPVVGRAQGLRVMTFNVQKFQNFQPEQVAAAILKENPDVVCLQEANWKAPPTPLPKAFRDALSEYQIIQRGQTAILSKFPITFGTAFALRGGTDGRPAQLATVMVGKQPVSLVCVHLQYFPWDRSISVGQASRNLMKETRSLEDLVRNPGIPTVVAGDFNTLPHGRTHRMMRKYLKDSFAETGKGFGMTLPAIFPLKRLDYIYTGYGLRPLKCWVSKTVASDHRAVVANLGWE